MQKCHWVVFVAPKMTSLFQRFESNASALMVVKPEEQKSIAGIVTERRDYLQKIKVQEISPKSTKVGDITVAISSYCSEFDQLHRKMCQLAESGQVREALKVLNSMATSSVSDYNRLLSCYVKSGNLALDELLCIYFGLRERGLLPDAMTYNVLFKGLIFIDSLRDALIVVVEMHRNGYSPSFRCLSELLEKLLQQGNLKESVYIVEFMLLLDYSPAETVLTMLILKLIDSFMLDEACRFFNMLLCMGHFWSPFVYNPILWALCKCDCSVVALSYMCSMKKRGFALNTCSYNALVYVFGKNGTLDDVDRVLSEMDSVGRKLNVITYTIIAQHLCENGKIKDALGILETMEKDGCEPNLYTYNIILRTLSQRNDLVGVDAMLSCVDKKGLTPDHYTYTALAGGMVKAGNVDGAYKLLVDAISSGCDCAINVSVFNVYIHTLALTNRSVEALSVVEKMTEIGLVPDKITYGTLLKALCLEGHLEEALEILDKLGDAPTLLDIKSFTIVLFAACKLCDSSIINRVLKKMMLHPGMKLDALSFRCLVRYFCSIGQLSECYNLLRYYMLTNNNDGNSLDTRSLNVFIHGVYKKRLLGVDQARKLLTCFRKMGALPESTTYNILIQAALRQGADAVASEFVQEMYKQGVKPDIVTFRILNNSLLKMGEISDAFKRLNLLFESGFAPDVVVYNAFLDAMLRRGKFGDAVLLLKHMVSYGCEPNYASVKIIKKAIKMGWMNGFPQAKELLEFVRCVSRIGNQQRNFF